MQSPVPIPDNAQWRKSTRSDQGENCVELWRGPKMTAIRDSKNADSLVLTLSSAALSALLTMVAK